jgi:oxygen-dependent protoporphyrinogen oxidase
MLLSYIGGAQDAGIAKLSNADIVKEVHRDIKTVLLKDDAPEPKVSLSACSLHHKHMWKVLFGSTAYAMAVPCGFVRCLTWFVCLPGQVLGVRLWPTAIPQYNKGHLDILKTLEAGAAKLPGLFLGGNYRTGVAFGDCVAYGMDEAGRIADYLAAQKKDQPKIKAAAKPEKVVVSGKADAEGTGVTVTKDKGVITTLAAEGEAKAPKAEGNDSMASASNQ